VLQKLFAISCLLLLFFSVRIKAQTNNYVFQHLTTKDGLSSNFVQSVFQDSKGLYWVSTTSGLQIFDGYGFSKPFRAGRDLLSSSKVTESKDGILWISTANSLYRYNRINEHFTQVVPPGDKPEMNLTVIEDSLGNTWLLNKSKLYKYDTNSNKLITWLIFPLTDPGFTAGAIAFNKHSNIIWIANGTTLYEISTLKRKIIKEVKMPPMVGYIWMDGNTYLWISFWNQYLWRYNTITGEKDVYTTYFKKPESQAINSAVVTCFSRDRSGRLWIGSVGGGLWFLDESLNQFVQLKTDKPRHEGFYFNETVYSVMIDKEESIWVSSDKGINIFNPSTQKFYNLNNLDLPTSGMTAEISQKPFQTSTGDILIGTHNAGWLQYDSNFNLKRNFSVVLNTASKFIDTCKTIVNCFGEDKTGNIWIGYRGGLIGIYQPGTGVLKYKLIPEFRKRKICDIQCDAAGNMWFALRASDSNLVKWDIGLRKYKVYNDSLLWYRNDQESSILVTKKGEIWVQTFGNGVYRFDPLKEKIVEIYREKQLPYNIPSAVQGISALNDSIIAIASFVEGFFLLNNTKKSITLLNTDNGLPSNIARGITRDNRNNYWATMLSDLVTINPVTKKIISFDEEEGVLNKSFYPGFTKLRDGRLMILSNTGLLYFHPDSIKTQPPPPDVLITSLKISNKHVLLDSILKANKNSLPLKYDQNFLTIEYVSIAYLNRKKNQYFYKLQGLDKGWQEAGTQRIATYTNLNPGKYVFMVRCQNRDDIFSKNITSLYITITPPLWRTWWAYTLYGIIFCAVAFFIYRNRLNLLERKQQAEIKAMVATQEEERKRISRDLHDDVGTKLSALKLFVSSLHEKASHVNNEEIKSLAKSSEQFITEAMQDVRQLLLNLSPAVLEEFGYTIAVEGLVNKINETKQIKFSLVVFGMKQRVHKEYELALYRITQELINNVLKHAEAQHVSLQIGQRDGKIILMIEDDGKGFDINTHRDGYGLHNLDARTKLMHGNMNIDSKQGKGTSVLIKIPYNFNGI